MEIEIITINNTPVFSSPDVSPHWSRVYGATFDKNNQRWLFPAFPPFIDNVLHDIENVYKDLVLNEKAQKWIEEVGTYDSWRETVGNLDLPTTSYEHQLQGTAELLYNYRWILRWEMGTGKSKVVVDAVNYLKCKTLILCPRIALDNWTAEIKEHSGGELSTLTLKGARKRKIELLREFDEYDVIVTTFDTARVHGTPRLFPKTVRTFERALRFPHQALKQILKRINDENTQAQMAHDWIKGKPPREIKEEIKQITQGHPQWILDLPYETITADESHRIARIQSMRTKICLQLSQKASRRWELSGTLTQGDPRHLFPQLKFLAPYLIPEDWKKFGETFLVKSPYNDKIVTGYKNLHILNTRVNNISSEKKLEECVDLPERRFETIYFSLSGAQKRDYNTIVSTSTLEYGGDAVLEIANGAIKISKLLQLCSGFVYVPKESDICDTCAYLRDCVSLSVNPGSARCKNSSATASDNRISLKYPDNPKLSILKDKLKDMVISSKVIIWACFDQELDDIEELLDREKWGYVRVDGSTTHRIKELETKFETDDTCRVYLAQISTGISITLNAAKYTIYYSRDWSPEHRKQSLFRNFRIGQDKRTIVYDICARGTIEAQQLTALQSKADVAELLTNKIECVLCNQYSECLRENISPWTTNCVLSTNVEKKIARARTI